MCVCRVGGWGGVGVGDGGDGGMYVCMYVCMYVAQLVRVCN